MITSIVNLNKVKACSKQFRFDAEYFKPEYLSVENKIKALKHVELRDCISLLTDYHANGSYESLRDNVKLLTERSYAYMIRTVDFEKDDYETGVIYVDEHAYNFLAKSKVFGTEVIVNKIGNAGKVYIVPPLKRPMTLGMNQFMLRSNKLSNNCFLYVYLTCKYGRLQLEQRITGAVPLSIDKESVKSVLVPCFDSSFQDFISHLMEIYFKYAEVSKQQYREAENTLLSELGLLNWKPKHSLCFVKKYSDTVTAERIDAEYFQPMYEEIVERIKQYKKGYKPLGEIVRVKDKNFQPKDDVTYRYIELANISANGNINGFIEALGKELPTRARRKVNEGDVIVSTIEGSLSSIALITKDLDNALCSTGFFVVNSEEINSETLLVLLKSPVGQLQLKKGCSGTILTAIGEDEFKRIILPDLRTEIQDDIKKKITEMYELKALSKRLLEIAKRGVEMAIEKDEESAEKWMLSKINKIGVKLNA